MLSDHEIQSHVTGVCKLCTIIALSPDHSPGGAYRLEMISTSYAYHFQSIRYTLEKGSGG